MTARAYTIICLLLPVLLMLLCGCGRKATSNTPAGIKIYRTLEPHKIYNMVELDVKLFFKEAGAIDSGGNGNVTFTYSQILHPKLNEFNFFNEDTVPSGELGNASQGRDHLIVSQQKILLWFGDESDVHQKAICDVAITHEIGHCFLGGGEAHHIGSYEHIMSDNMRNVFANIKIQIRPIWTSSEKTEIKGDLGYT